MSCGVGCRLGSDPALLWLWCRPVATAPIRPLAREPPYAMGAAQEIAQRQNKTKQSKTKNIWEKKKKRKEKKGLRWGCEDLVPSSASCWLIGMDECFLFVCLGPHPWHMEVPRLGVESELQLPAYATATATPDLSCICNLHHSSSRQRRILNPLNEARDRT